jgi:hypothetical protein
VSELVIGSRRPKQQRRLRSLAIAAGLALLASLVCYFIYRRVVSYPEPTAELPSVAVSAGPAPHGAGEWALFWGRECSLSHLGQLAVLRAVGKPHTLGACHGRLLGRAVTDATAPLSAVIRAAIPDEGLFGETRRGPRLRWRLRLLDDGTPPARIEEVAGVVHGVARGGPAQAPPFETLVRVQAAFDVGAPSGPSPGAEYGSIARSLSFVMTGAGAPASKPTPTATPPTAKPGAGAPTAAKPAAGAPPPPPPPPRLLVGRSFSLFGADDGGDRAASAPLISLMRPEGAVPYASVGWPGLVGVVTGINAEGIAVAVHPIATADVRMTRQAQPLALLARDMLEHAHTLDEAIRLVEQAPPLGAAGFLVVDGRRRRLAWIERSPTRIRVVRDASPPVKGDFFTTEPFAAEMETERARRMRPSTDRVARTVELVRRAPPGGVEQAVAVLRDSARPGGAALPAGHRAAIDDPEAAHTVVIDPIDMVLWVAEGPGAGSRFRAIDLLRELRGEPRPAPLADLPPDPQRDPGIAADVVTARRGLRAARAARAAGDLRLARELSARALARRADLPEALLLAGDLATADGDTEAARAFYRRALDLGPDRGGDDEEIRARLSAARAH